MYTFTRNSLLDIDLKEIVRQIWKERERLSTVGLFEGEKEV